MIAKALASMLDNSYSPELASKFDLLQRSFRKRFDLQGIGNGAGLSEKKSIFKCFLWTIMQRGILNPAAARRLTRLDTIAFSSRPNDQIHNTDTLPETLCHPTRSYAPLDMADGVDLEWFPDEDDRMLTDRADYGEPDFCFEDTRFNTYEDFDMLDDLEAAKYEGYAADISPKALAIQTTCTPLTSGISEPDGDLEMLMGQSLRTPHLQYCPSSMVPMPDSSSAAENPAYHTDLNREDAEMLLF
jgi:hypothetical protein